MLKRAAKTISVALAFAMAFAFAPVSVTGVDSCVPVSVSSGSSSGESAVPTVSDASAASSADTAVANDADVDAGSADSTSSGQGTTKLAAVSTQAESAVTAYFEQRAAALVDADAASSEEIGSDELAAQNEQRSSNFKAMATNANFTVSEAESEVDVSEAESEDDGTLSVSVYERTTFTYDDLSDGEGGSDIAIFGTSHELTLAPSDAGAYVVTADAYDESDITGMCTTGDDAASGAAAGTDMQVAESSLVDEGTQLAEDLLSTLSIQSAEAASSVSYSKNYDPEAAIAYSDQYALNYNTSYYNFNPLGGDCASFVSQCLAAGELEQDGGWYYKSSSDYNSPWTYCPDMVKYFRGKFGSYKTVRGKYVKNPSASKVWPGSPVLYMNGGVWAHATICVGYNSAGTPIINAHNSDRYHMPYTYWDTTRCTIQLTSSNQYKTTFTTTTGGSSKLSTSSSSTSASYTWRTTGSDTVMLVSYSGTKKKVSIGSSVTGPDGTSYKITRINDEAFYDADGGTGNAKMQTLSIGDKVERVGQYAFKNCTALKKLDIGKKVVRLNACAFEGCTKLASITGGEALKYIDTRAFYGCTTLASLPALAKLKTLSASAFCGCTALASLPDSLQAITSVGDSAFSGCTSLTVLPAMAKLKTIGASAFNGCTALKKVDGLAALTSIGKKAFYGCTSLKSVNITSVKLVSIGDGAFRKCSALSSAVFASTELAKIGKNAFKDCSALTVLTLATTKLKSSNIGEDAFAGTPATLVVTAPSSKVAKYTKWFTAKGLTEGAQVLAAA